MAGKKGQQRLNLPRCGRQRMWSAMRILRTFSLADLMRTTEQKLDNVRKYVVRLTRHGYLTELPGWVRGEEGSYKQWSIRVNPGPKHPLLCIHCGQSVSVKECRPQEVKP